MIETLEIDYRTAANYLSQILPRGGKIALGGSKKNNINLTEWIDGSTGNNRKTIEAKVKSLLDRGANNIFFTPFCFDRERRIRLNARSSAAFLCDLDVGASGYESKHAARYALDTFVSETGLEPTYIIDSGYGIHAYWVLDQAIPLPEWERMALPIHALRMAWQIREDTTVPRDPARYIRLPGSINNKQDNPQPVYIVDTGPLYNAEDLNNQIEDLFSSTEKGHQFLMSDEFEKMRRTQSARNLVNEASEFADQNVYDCKENLAIARDMLMAIPPVLYDDLNIDSRGKLVSHGRGSPSYEHWRSVIFSALATGLSGIEDVVYEWASQTSATYNDWQKAVDKVIQSDGATGNSGVGVGSLIHFSRAFARESNEVDPSTLEFLDKENILPFDPVALLKTKKQSDPNAVQVTDLDDMTGESQEVEAETLELTDRDRQCAVMPRGFKRKEGYPGIYIQIAIKDDETGETTGYELEEVVDKDLYVVGVVQGDDGRQEFILKVFHPFQTPKLYRYSLGILSDSRAFDRSMAEAGILPVGLDTKKGGSTLMSYITAQVRRLSKLARPEKEVSSFGWTDDKTGFAKGSYLYTESGAKELVGMSRTLENYASSLDAHGDMEAWKSAVDIFNRDEYQMCQMLIALAMGSPLSALYGAEHSGGFVYIWSTKGSTGKTTIQRVMQSIWGKPTQSILIGDMNTSDTTLPNQMGTLKDISLAIDEGATETISAKMNDQSAKIARLIKQSTQGREKMRSDQSGHLRADSSEWTAFTSISLNMSLGNLLGSGFAGPLHQRVLEVPYHVPRFTSFSDIKPSEVYNFGHTIVNNYGLAGDLLADYYVKNRQSLKDEMHTEMMRLADLGGSLSQHMRFYQAMFAAAHVAIRVAKKLGLVAFDTDKLQSYMDNYLMSALDQNEEVTTLDEAALLSQFLNENAENTLTVESTDNGGLKLMGDMPRNKVVARIDKATGEVWVERKELETYARNHHVSMDDLRNFIAETEGIPVSKIESRKRPYAGLGMDTKIRLWMVMFNMDKIQGEDDK